MRDTIFMKVGVIASVILPIVGPTRNGKEEGIPTGITKYLYYTALDGDYKNDYLTHIPNWLQPVFQLIGRILASVIGA